MLQVLRETPYASKAKQCVPVSFYYSIATFRSYEDDASNLHTQMNIDMTMKIAESKVHSVNPFTIAHKFVPDLFYV